MHINLLFGFYHIPQFFTMILYIMDKKERNEKEILTDQKNNFKIKDTKAQIEQMHMAKVEEEK
jgi:hypothetical protein